MVYTHPRDFPGGTKLSFGLPRATIIFLTLIGFAFLPSTPERHSTRERIMGNHLAIHWGKIRPIFGRYWNVIGMRVCGKFRMSRQTIQKRQPTRVNFPLNSWNGASLHL